MNNNFNYHSGDKVEVATNINGKEYYCSDGWKSGIFQSYISTIDNTYNFNILLGNGMILRNALPENVRKAERE